MSEPPPPPPPPPAAEQDPILLSSPDVEMKDAGADVAPSGIVVTGDNPAPQEEDPPAPPTPAPPPVSVPVLLETPVPKKGDAAGAGAGAGAKGDDHDEEQDVQVLSPQQAEREFRRKRRRQLYHLLKRPDAPPSFLAVLQAEPQPFDDDKDDGDDYEIPPPIVVIDVDAYLGFHSKKGNAAASLTSPDMTTSSSSFMVVPNHVPSSSPTSRLRSSSTTTAIGNPASSPTTPSITTANITTTPADEGWYEGSRPMAMPEDATFLSEMHVWIRQHLEYFSASAVDIQQTQQMGRRTKAIRGKVGIRCIHCARALLPQPQDAEQEQQGGKMKKVAWPPGAVTYPSDFSGLYSGVSQKPQLHFEVCPYLPQDSTLARMLQEAKETEHHRGPGVGIGKRKRMVQGVSGLMYYIISCQRIGLQEVGKDLGLRFTRDLTLEPLDFESVRNQVERERPDLIPRQYQPKSLSSSYSSVRAVASPPLASTSMATAGGGRGGVGSPDAVTSGADGTGATTAVMIQSDPATQAVLQKALEVADDPQHRLIRRSDKALLSDYMFIAISQMAICHASPEDLAARGKKTKMMRIGLAGFCCRHCQFQNSFSCRSFSSAPDNLASAISNSFVLHLQKCPFCPPEIKAALAASKKIHSRQMANVVYGSQRKMFFEMWERMRAADLPEPANTNNQDDDVDDEDTQTRTPGDGDEEWNPDSDMPMDNEEDDASISGKDATTRPSSVPSTAVDANRPNARGIDFPVSNDPETQATLKAAEDSWDPEVNDNLILPEDRYLVSDYVFLTMRQLKIAMPTPSDFRGNRRNNVLSRLPGLGCIHCAHDPTLITPAGRSFPSAPDNMASALNSSFHNHMQHCPHLDASIKRVLAQLRKIHSQQCSSLTFGSQRRFFNKVYEKLKQIPMTKEQLACFNNIGAPAPKESSSSRSSSNDPIMDNEVFREHSFVAAGTVGIPFWQCLQCRMVPFEFRTVGAVHYVRPLVQHLKQHNSLCQRDGISLGWVNNAVREVCERYQQHDKLEEALRPLIEIVVGNDPDLTQLFLGCVSARGKNQPTQTMNTSGWWRRLPTSVDVSSLQTAFETCAATLELPSSKFRHHPKILRALEIMSPCLQVPLMEAAAVATQAEPADPTPPDSTVAVAEKIADAVDDPASSTSSQNVTVQDISKTEGVAGAGDAPGTPSVVIAEKIADPPDDLASSTGSTSQNVTVQDKSKAEGIADGDGDAPGAPSNTL